jgi:3-hydroxybutyryl-CoA dehydrogenase
MEIKKIFVAGAGLMGSGIAQVCAQAGYQVTMRDITDKIIQKSIKTIAWSVGKLVEKVKAAGAVAEIMGRLKVTTDIAAAAEADIVFEAIIENLDAKRKFEKMTLSCNLFIFQFDV